MPETPLKFAASILKNDGTGTPLREYNVTETYDNTTDTHFYVCYIEALSSSRFAVCVKSRDPHQSRMGLMLFIDDAEQNRVGLRPGFAVQLTGRPVAANLEQPFEFGGNKTGSGNIRIELWRSIVTEVSEGAVTYSTVDDKTAPIASRLAAPKEATSITQVSKVQYLDKQPRVVFVFEYRSRAELAQMNLLNDPTSTIPHALPIKQKLLPSATKIATTTSSSTLSNPVVHLASKTTPTPLTSPRSSLTETALSQDVIRRVLIQAIDNPDTARALIEACMRKHGADVIKNLQPKTVPSS